MTYLIWGVFILINVLFVEIVYAPRITRNTINNHLLLFYTCNKKIHSRQYVDITQMICRIINY